MTLHSRTAAPPCRTRASWRACRYRYEALRDLYQQPLQVKTHACLGAPGFNYVVGCVTSDLPAQHVYETKCSGLPCKGLSGPPFYNGRAIDSACAATCGTDATEPVDRLGKNPKRYCDGGKVSQDEIEEAYLMGLRLEPGAGIFAIMYVLGLGALFMMHLQQDSNPHPPAPAPPAC